jgi:hypothetical protein
MDGKGREGEGWRGLEENGEDWKGMEWKGPGRLGWSGVNGVSGPRVGGRRPHARSRVRRTTCGGGRAAPGLAIPMASGVASEWARTVPCEWAMMGFHGGVRGRGSDLPREVGGISEDGGAGDEVGWAVIPTPSLGTRLPWG